MDEISQEVASQVIQTHWRNVVKKVLSGKTLTVSEADLLSNVSLSNDDFKKNREKALLGKWVKGRRLSVSEMQEIERFLPRSELEIRPSFVEDEAVNVKSSSEVFVLSSVKKHRTGYLHQYPHYAVFYEASERTIKRWVAIGKSNLDPAPLDSVPDLYAWWSRNMTQKCPEKIVSLLVKYSDSSASISEVEEVINVPELEVSEIVSEEEKGIEAMLNRLQEIEVLLSKKARDPGGAKPWLDTIARITSVITKLREENEKHGKLIPREMAEVAIHEFHAPIQNGVRGIGVDFCRNAGFPWTPIQEVAWAKCCDELFSRFDQEVFRAV